MKAVRLAHVYGQKEMSNYILYNFDDTPEDFYERLKINIDLNEEFKNDATKTSIYSFPMRYIPLDAKNRDIDTGNDHHLWGAVFFQCISEAPVRVVWLDPGNDLRGSRNFLMGEWFARSPDGCTNR